MNAITNPPITSTPHLQQAAEMVTIRGMTALSKDHGHKADIFDDPEAVLELADRAFAKARGKAIEENDRLGITSVGGEKGKIVTRKPPATKPPAP